MFDKQSAAARQSRRLRINHNFDDSFEHPSLSTKDETFFVLRGSFGLFVFDENGHIAQKALESGSAFFEAKPDAHEASTDKQLATWTPEEGSAEAPLYLAKLKQSLLR